MKNIDKARDKFNEAVEKVREDHMVHRKGRGQGGIWTCCGVTRPIEQRCSCGEGADA